MKERKCDFPTLLFNFFFKELLGQSDLAWKIDQKEGALQGQPVYDHEVDGDRPARTDARPQQMARNITPASSTPSWWG